jgi:hypothetical protein
MPADTLTLIHDLTFVQGLPRDFVVSDWKNPRGQYIDLTNCTAHFSIRTTASETAPLLLDITGPAGSDDYTGIQVYPRQILVHLDEAMTDALKPLAGARPERGFPASTPVFKAGVYELRVMSPDFVLAAVMRGDVFITLGVIDNG